MSILAVLIDLPHTYISHEAKKGERLGLPKTQIFLFSGESVADSSDFGVIR
jgi:hypothetical protein